VLVVSRRSSRYVYRRRRGPRPAAIATFVALLVVLGVAVAIVFAGGAGDSHAPAATAATPRAAPRRRRRRPAAGLTAVQRQRSREIDALLRVTPFIAAGAPTRLRSRRVIALTFDDGPSPYTSAIVRILVRMHVPATFFVVGQQLRYFSAGLRDELAHGFEVGDHTENHVWLPHYPAAEQYAQIHDQAVAIEQLGAPAPRLFRPPYGVYDAATLAILRRMRMLMVTWSIDPGDWRRPGAKAILRNVLANARPGAIVIMHDGGGDRTQTIAALPAIVRGLRRQGYRLVTVADLARIDPPARHQALPHVAAA